MRCVFLCLLNLIGLALISAQDDDGVRYKNKRESVEVDPDFWRHMGVQSLEERLRKPINTAIAKNIIFFLGDGMGVSTVTSGRIYKGQKRRDSGEEAALEMDSFPYVSLSKTYSADRQTTDSAASATAYLCGVKANQYTLGVTSKVKRGDCDAAAEKENQVKSIMDWAQKEGKWTGIVSTESVTDASPAGTYAHSADRKYEANVPQGCTAKDIAQQLIHDRPGSKFRVILGGGRSYFLPKVPKPVGERMIAGDNPAINGAGVRTDGRNLIEEWLQRHTEANRSAAYLWNKNHLKMLHEGDYNVDYVLGLFAEDNFAYSMDKLRAKEEGTDPPGGDEPSLEEMTIAAINLLQKSPNGFVLFVEGAKIDTAHHANLPGHSLEELYQFDKSIRAASKLTKEEETLTIVTADHSHAFTLSGYALRGSDILGNAGKDDRGYSYRTLSYAAGPGFSLNSEDTQRYSTISDYLAPAMFPKKSGVHGGEDVAVFAKGPWAHLFSGVHENSYIPYALGYAACIGPNKKHCAKTPPLSRKQPIVSLNHTLIDHINGQPIAKDVMKDTRAPTRPPHVPSVFYVDPSQVKRADTQPNVSTSSGSAFKETDSTHALTSSEENINANVRVVRKVFRRTNPFEAPDTPKDAVIAASIK